MLLDLHASGEFARAEQWAAKLTERNAGDSLAWTLLGECRYRQGKRAPALVAVARALQWTPGASQARVLSARIRVDDGE